MNISETSMLLQLNSHYDYTHYSQMQGLISTKYRRYQAQAGNFELAYCSRALESSDWFPLVTHISSHQSGSTYPSWCEHSDVSENGVKDKLSIMKELDLFLPFQVYFPRLFVAILVTFVHSPWSSGNNVAVLLHNGLGATHHCIGSGERVCGWGRVLELGVGIRKGSFVGTRLKCL